MNAPVFSPRLLAVLGISQPDIVAQGKIFVADVDHTGRRFRDAIKAGASPVTPPSTQGNRRIAHLADPTTNTTLTIRSPLPDQG